MTSIPTSRPALTVARPAHAASSVSSGATSPVIDPIKLLKKHKWMLIAAAAVGLMVGAIAHVVLMLTYPIYSSSIVYECRPLEDDKGGGTPVAGGEEEFKRFMATQVQVLASDRIVDKTLNDPRLLSEAKKWTDQYMIGSALDTAAAAKDLKRNLSASIIGESAFVRVSFWWTNKEEATAIVRLLGQTYQNDRKNVNSLDSSDRKQMLQNTVDDISSTIGKLALDRTRKLQDQKVESLDERLTETNRTIGGFQEKLLEVRGDREMYIVHRNKLENELKSESGLTYPDAMRKKVDEDPTIQRIKIDINEMETLLTAKRKEGLGETHRDLIKIRNQWEAGRMQLQAQQEKLLRQAFDSELESVKTAIASADAQEADMLKKMEESKQRATELTQIMAQVHDIDREIDRQTETRARLQEDLKRLELAPNTRVILYQDAQVPKQPSFPRLSILLPTGAIVALGLALGVVVLIEIVDQRIKSPADVAMIPRTRVLGLVPHASEDPGTPQRIETVFRDLPSGVLAESYRQLRATLVKKMHQGGHKSLLVMSGMPGSGTTTAVCNLAWSLAAADLKVLVIDANFRRPGVHRVFEVREGPGLADVLTGSATIEASIQTTANERVHVLSAGSAEQRRYERLTSSPMSEVLRQATEKYDIVLIDVAPAMVAGDGLSLAHRCDATMLVVRALGEKRGLVARLRNELSESKAEFLGVLVNSVRSAAGGYLKGNILASHKYQNGKE
jgi:polysaccharide biosynthesis transport protein